MKSATIPNLRELDTAGVPLYIQTGTRAYNDHYRHLWPEGDTTPYLTHNFTREKVITELQLSGIRNWIVEASNEAVGICKLVFNTNLQAFSEADGLFIEKIYLVRTATGMGYGSRLFASFEAMAQEAGLPYIWLEAMQKGPALQFYLQNGYRIFGPTRIPFSQAIEAERPMWIMLKEL